MLKETLLISSVLEGSRKGRTLKAITEDVSKQIHIPASVCQSYWYNNVPDTYRDDYKQIKFNQENNWTDEDMKMLDYIINIEYGHLTPYDVLPIASERLERHIDVVRKKLFALQREQRLKDNN